MAKPNIRVSQILTDKHRQQARTIALKVWQDYDIDYQSVFCPHNNRLSPIVQCRHMAIWIVYHDLGLSLINTAEVFKTGLGSIQHAVKAVNELCLADIDENSRRTKLRAEIKKTLFPNALEYQK